MIFDYDMDKSWVGTNVNHVIGSNDISTFPVFFHLSHALSVYDSLAIYRKTCPDIQIL